MNQTSNQIFMFVTQGHVQRMTAELDGEDVLVWPVAHNHQEALRLCRWVNSRSHRIGMKPVSPALIGSIDGETLHSHVELAFDDGCVAIFTPIHWDSNGDPVWGFIDLLAKGGAS